MEVRKNILKLKSLFFENNLFSNVTDNTMYHIIHFWIFHETYKMKMRI